MRVARLVLLTAAATFASTAVADDAWTDPTPLALTLSPAADSLILTRSSPSTPETWSGPVTQGTASNGITQDAKPLPLAAYTPPTTTSLLAARDADFNAAMALDNDDETSERAPTVSDNTGGLAPTVDVTPSPRLPPDHRTAPGPVATTNGTTTTTTLTPPPASLVNKSSLAPVDSLNSRSGGVKAGDAAGGMGTILPAVFGSVACVGVLAVAVAIKKRRGAETGEHQRPPNSDCEYSGADLTPDNRALCVAKAKSPPIARKAVATTGAKDLAASTAVADFVRTHSSTSSSSPFGSTRCKVRVSSPNQSFFANRETNMEFQTTCPLREKGHDATLSIGSVRVMSSRTTHQSQQ
ncbi:unnamed protein product [Hyaloperonospora brassicae]|uniref:RxLR effector candidate protein n=1 Tax=Hyaloperonospora brassicae TaxID=162125 RepID=A0AAV0V3A9_HYABA|nr:unnamed protein product [Hyaloperonospora brassicae]